MITRENGRVVGWGGWNLHTFVHSHTPQHRHRGSKQSNAVLHTAPVHVLFICLLKRPETLSLSLLSNSKLYIDRDMPSTHTKYTCENQTTILTTGPVRENKHVHQPGSVGPCCVRDSDLLLFIYWAEENKCQMKWMETLSYLLSSS